MKKMTKRTISLLMAAIATAGFVSVGTGCGPDENKIDKTKTQLRIYNYDAGIGRTWIEATGAAFEQAFANYSFEEGKTGVQVHYEHDRTYDGETLLTSMNKSKCQVFFHEYLDYIQYANGNTTKVTDIINAGAITGVDASGNFTREEKKISEKVSSEMLGYLNYNGEYYGLPFYLACKGAICDVDLWNEQRLFFAKNGCPSEVIVNATDVDAAIAAYNSQTISLDDCLFVDQNGYRSAEDTTNYGLSAGPDGIYDTYDDGFPATFDELYLLLDYMVQKTVTPFTWTGKYPGYVEMLTNQIAYNSMGTEQVKLRYSMNGQANDLVVIENGAVKKEGDRVVTESKQISTANPDDTYRHIGYYYALQFSEKLGKNSTWVDTASAYGTSLSHIGAQSKFLTSVTTSGANRIAMLIDGGWWQQESEQTFSIMAQDNSKYSKENRNFKFMPMPNATAEVFAERKLNNGKNVIVVPNNSFCFLNGNLKDGSAEKEVAEVFYSYIHSDKMLNLFAEKTNIMRPFAYETNADSYAKLSPYGKNYVKYVQEYSDIVYPYASSATFIKNFGFFSTTGTPQFASNTAFGDLSYPTSSFHNSDYTNQGLNAESYFVGVYKYRNNAWKNAIK